MKRVKVKRFPVKYAGNLARIPQLKPASCQTVREKPRNKPEERLKRQWVLEQEMIKNEPLQITYSYWDGRCHRRTLQMRKCDTIGVFLRAVQQQLSHDFHEVWTTSVENLLYVKEDLIIPHQHSFYELIITRQGAKVDCFSILMYMRMCGQ